MRKKSGFTLIELLIVITILAILVILAIWSITTNLAKARDGKRKSDLDRIKIAMEDYYVDKSEYPPVNLLSDCGGEGLKPYLSSIPCDPKTTLPYCYIYDSVSPVGQDFRVLASFENIYDDSISKLGCDNPGVYCGYETECQTLVGYTKFDYGISSSNISIANENIGSGNLGNTPTPSPSLGPLPSTVPGTHACYKCPNCSQGVCNNYSTQQNAINSGCPITWSDSNCNNYCDSIPSYGLCTK